MVTAFAFSTVDDDGTTYVTAMQNVRGMKLQKDAYYVFMLDSRHRRRNLEMLRDVYSIKWGSLPLDMRYTFPVDVRTFSLTKATKVGNRTNISTAIVQHEAKLTDKMQSLLS